MEVPGATGQSLQKFSKEANIRLVEGLVDRVGYRNMMDTGVTPMDDIAGEPVQRSLLAARTEANRLAARVITRLGLKTSQERFVRV